MRAERDFVLTKKQKDMATAAGEFAGGGLDRAEESDMEETFDEAIFIPKRSWSRREFLSQ